MSRTFEQMQSDFKRAVEYFQGGEFDLAISLLESCYDDGAYNFDSAHILGVCYASKKDYGKAFEYFGIAFEIDSTNSVLNLNMAKAYALLGNIEKVREHAEICLRYDSDNVDARKLLSDILSYGADYKGAMEFYRQSQFELALPLFEKHLKTFPDDVKCMKYLGISYCRIKNYDVGMHYFYLALSYKPDMYSIYYDIAFVFFSRQQYGHAFGNIKLCLSYNSEYKAGLYLLSKICQGQGEFSQAVLALRKYLGIAGDDNLILSEIIYCNLSLFRWDEIDLDFAELLRGDYVNISPLNGLLIVDDLTLLRDIGASHFTHGKFDSGVKDSGVKGSGVKDSGVDEVRVRDKIRVGYISSDIDHHPVFYISSHLLREHDRSDFEIYVYSTSVLWGRDIPINFAIGESDYYRDLSNLSDSSAYDLVCGDDLDILVDLMGFTGGMSNRKSLLEMGLAPVLINYLGYMGTMGSGCHDYILADDYVIKDRHAVYYSEAILRVDCVFAYDRSLLLSDAVSVKSRVDFGLPEDGIILGVFNRPIKITESIFDCWMRILSSCSGSYLWVSFKFESSRLAFIRRVLERGISADRIIASSNVERSEYMRRYDFCDLSLDTYPYNGGITSLDALYGSCPILTMSGETMMSRITGSLLTSLGLDELIVGSFDEYVEKAIELIGDRDRLLSLREHISDRLPGSAIYDSEKMTRQLEEHYRFIVSQNSGVD